MSDNSNKIPTIEQWEPFAQMKFLLQRDELIEGYCIPLDGKRFRIFVANELTGTQRGFFLKLMYEWGKDEEVNLVSQKDKFPQTTEIFNRYLPGSWINRGAKHRSYKYIVFGKGLNNQHLACSLMHTIIADIAAKNTKTEEDCR